MKIIILEILFLMSIGQLSLAQADDATTIRQIYDRALTSGTSYEMLKGLTQKFEHRLSGSPVAAGSVKWMYEEMGKLGFDSVWLQPVVVPHWVRGEKESVTILKLKNTDAISLNACALGGSVGTGSRGITANVVEVKDFATLEKLGTTGIQGKIVFFNRPMDPRLINTFDAYIGAVDQRLSGASEAAKYGAVAIVIRSLGLNDEEYPHTGLMKYATDIDKIPAFAISTRHSSLLSERLKVEAGLQLYLESHCEIMSDVSSFNVIGEIRGKINRNEIIVVGGHLDSWDLGQGAHDDGAGCVQSIDVLRILSSIGYAPAHTLRVVLFMNEENGVRGGLKYAEAAAARKARHLAAIESDRGGFTPRGFSISASTDVRKKIQSWRPLLEPYGLTDFNQEGSGTDISPLASQGVPLLGLLPDSQRYFTYHHTTEDTFDKVDKRELELGGASMAAIVYLIDKYGLQ
jgi:carboxypeptidase Q